MTNIEAITLGTAVLGAVLGVVNTVQAVLRDRVKLVVMPAFTYVPNKGLELLSIDVVNVGMVPVTIIEVGFMGGLLGKKRSAFVSDFVTGACFPHRLEPRTAISFRAHPAALENPKVIGARHAYARTACLKRFTGGHKFMRQLRRDHDPEAQIARAPED